MISLKSKQSGFTIVELLIVIVVIGILATLVIVTFSGIQQKARDTKRQTDITALASQLEVFYANNTFYPTLTNLQDNAWVTANLKGLDTAGLTAPGGTGNTMSNSASTTTYAYSATPSGCDNTGTNLCTGFTITANREGSTTPYTKQNLSN